MKIVDKFTQDDIPNTEFNGKTESFIPKSLKNELVQSILLGIATSYLKEGILFGLTISGTRLIAPRLINAITHCWRRTREGVPENPPPRRASC